MAMSRAEIELLIKARDEAKSTFQELNKTIKSTGSVVDDTSESMDKLGKRTKDAGAQGVAAGVIFGNLATIVGRELVQGFKDSIAAANDLDRGLVGLSSVARAFNQDAGQAQEAAKKLASDGLMTVGEAAAGLKNLLAAGFGLDQAVVLMNRFKDSAAFGRQGALDFGQAIVGATEGIKNGNSALVDNAGVTKNLSVILQEAGLSANDLQKAQSDVNVRTAIFNGILKETNPQLGDTARYLDTAAGKQQQFNSQITIAEQKIGKALQPALASAIDTLTPMVQIVGNNADMFIHLATVVATVVGPLVAMKAATALGIPPFQQITEAAGNAMIAFGKVYTETGSLRGALNSLGTTAGITVGQLGLLKTAGLIAGAAFVGWEIGKIINDLTGLDKIVGNWLAHSAEAAGRAETQAAKQDVLNKAIRDGASANITYTDAIKFNNAINDIRLGKLTQTAEAQLKMIDAELYLGRITQEQATTQRAAIEAEQKAADVRKNRAQLTDILAIKEKQYRDEIAATGYTVGELVQILKKDETGFTSWAKVVHLSDDTIERLKDSLQDSNKALKDQETAHNKAEAAAKKHQAELEKLDETLNKFGVTTTNQVNKELHDLVTQIDAARAAGVPMKEVMHALGGEFMDLMTRAQKSKTEIKGLAELFDTYVEEAGGPIQATKDFSGVMQQLPGQTSAMGAELARLHPILADAAKEQERINKLFNDFGEKSPQQLREAADQAKVSYEQLVASGQATTEQLRAAWQEMVDAQLAASGKLPSLWQTVIAPGIINAMATVRDATADTFAAMLTGATGFKDGFLNIWQSIKQSVQRILAELLDTFLNAFLKGMIGAMSGQQGAFGKAFSGMFGGGSTGPGGLFGGLFGGSTGIAGGAGGYGPDFVGPIQQGSGSGGGLFGGFSNMSNMARFGGGGLMAGSGLLQLFTSKSRTGQVLGGLQAGAGIGTMIMPGIGTAIGAGVGALAGWLKGVGGPSQKEVSGREVVAAAEEQFRSGLTAGQKTEAGKAGWAGADILIAVRDAYLKIGKSSKDAEADVAAFWASSKEGPEAAAAAAKKLQDAIDQAGKKSDEAAQKEAAQAAERQKRIDDLTTKLTGINQELKTVQDSYANEAEESEIGVTERLAREHAAQLQQQADAVQKQIDEATAGAAEAGEAAGKSMHDAAGKIINDFGIDVSQVVLETADGTKRNFKDAALDVTGAFDTATGLIIGGFKEVTPEAEATRKGIEAAFADLGFHIPVYFDVQNVPTPPGPRGNGSGEGPENGAASGIYASGARGVATWFGEGGEPEVGGPASFFERIFTSLGVGTGRGGGGSPTLNLTLNVTGVMSDGDLRTTIIRNVVPIIHQAWSDNVNSARTVARESLGVG